MSFYKFSDGKLGELLLELGYESPVLKLIDIGASGGINAAWNSWGEGFSAIGFDMIGAEVDLLNEKESRPYVEYRKACIGVNDTLSAIYSNPVDVKSNYPVHKTSGHLATNIISGRKFENFEDAWRGSFNISEVPTNAGYANIENPLNDPYVNFYSKLFSRYNEPELITDKTTLMQQLEKDDVEKPIFLKIDVDGYEGDVLNGARELLSSGHVLGVDIEVQFHGPIEKNSGCFSDVDHFLRSLGFTLFNIECVHHGRSALPRPFKISVPAETDGGPIQWGNALYLRDLSDPLYQKSGRIYLDNFLVDMCCQFSCCRTCLDYRM